MAIIYEPKGKAKEYSDLAANLYKGCDHGCLYCYAPGIPPAKFRPREEFFEVKNRNEVVKQIRKEAPAYRDKEILLCFTCDPYSHFAADAGITRQAIEALHDGGATVNILTKGGNRSTADFDLLTAADKYGTTLTFLNDEDSLKWEPRAALPGERIAALKTAKAAGISTWASFEPVIDPEQTLELIELTHGITDFYKVGKWNHDVRADEIDWHSFAKRAKALLENLGVAYMIKKDLAAYLTEETK